MSRDPVTERIIECAYRVSNALGCGFLEKVYENALAYELRKSGFDVKQQEPVLIRYDGVVVGEYFADLLIDNTIIVELKTVSEFNDIHLAQCINYLKATRLTTCLLMNFAKPKLEVKRISN